MTGEEHKVAIVTGSAQGIGAEIAIRLAKDGYDVVLADLEGSMGNLTKVAKQAEAGRPGAKTVCIACDVTSKADVDALVESTVAQLGRLDCMVANAGIAPVGFFLDITEDMFDKITAVNVKGVLFCYQAAARQLIKQGWGGRLIAACSIAGMRGYPGFSAYSSTKFAVRSLNQSASQELAPHKINCNVYCPSPVPTTMWTAIDKDLTGLTGAPLGAITEQHTKQNPSGRLVEPKDVANIVSFLAGPDSSFMTGESLLVTGGDFLQ